MVKPPTKKIYIYICIYIVIYYIHHSYTKQLPSKTFQQTNKRPFGYKPMRPSSPKRPIDLQMFGENQLCTPSSECVVSVSNYLFQHTLGTYGKKLQTFFQRNQGLNPSQVRVVFSLDRKKIQRVKLWNHLKMPLQILHQNPCTNINQQKANKKNVR